MTAKSPASAANLPRSWPAQPGFAAGLVVCTVLLAACAGQPPPAHSPPASSTPSPGAVAPAAALPPVATAQPAAAPPATQPQPAATAAAATVPPPTLPYEQAVLSAAGNLLKAAAATLPAGTRQAVVIDPLVDGMTGAQSTSTRAMGAQLAALIREQYPQFDLQPFSAANVAKSPMVLIGTFTGVNAQRQTTGAREAWRICYAMADLKSGKLVSKGLAFSQSAGPDATPLPAFLDAPVFTDDPATLGYIRTCQGTRAGDPINPLYVDRILAATLVAEAVEAYDAGRYQDALALYTSASRSPAGDQLRVYNGLYLCHLKLGRREQASAAFRKIVEFGLAQQRLAVKFLFRPGGVAFAEGRLSAPYPGWIKTIGSQASTGKACLEVVGHSSASGPEPLNERLSQRRAEHMKSLLDTSAPELAKRTIASGMGSRQMLVGNGRDNASDALDRRVEFKVIGC